MLIKNPLRYLCFIGLMTLLSPALAQGASVQVAEHESYGSYLTDARGMSLYLFLRDSDSVSSCYEQCAQNWPPLLTEGEVEAGEGVDAALLSTSERTDGTTQVTYNDWPLYYFARDEAAGDIDGQEVGGVWFLVSVTGEQIEAPAAPQEAMPQAPDGSAWFNSVQTEAGQQAFAEHCAACHGSDMAGGGPFPPLTGPGFLSTWGGRSAHDLFGFISTQMPFDSPGSLDDGTYLNILAYWLAVHDYPAGEEELSEDNLADIVIAP